MLSVASTSARSRSPWSICIRLVSVDKLLFAKDNNDCITLSVDYTLYSVGIRHVRLFVSDCLLSVYTNAHAKIVKDSSIELEATTSTCPQLTSTHLRYMYK